MNRLAFLVAVLLAWVAVALGSSLHWGSYAVATGMLVLAAGIGPWAADHALYDAKAYGRDHVRAAA